MNHSEHSIRGHRHCKQYELEQLLIQQERLLVIQDIKKKQFKYMIEDNKHRLGNNKPLTNEKETYN